VNKGEGKNNNTILPTDYEKVCQERDELVSSNAILRRRMEEFDEELQAASAPVKALSDEMLLLTAEITRLTTELNNAKLLAQQQQPAPEGTSSSNTMKRRFFGFGTGKSSSTSSPPVPVNEVIGRNSNNNNNVTTTNSSPGSPPPPPPSTTTATTQIGIPMDNNSPLIDSDNNNNNNNTSSVNKLQSQLIDMIRTNKLLENQVHALEKEHEKATVEQETIVLELAKMGSLFNEEQRRNADLVQNIEELKREKESLHRDVAAATATSQKLGNQVMRLTEQLIEEKEKFNALDKSFAEFKKQAKEADDRIKREAEVEASNLRSLLMDETARREEAESRLLVESSNV
jgi:chromosome segregation ATPase